MKDESELQNQNLILLYTSVATGVYTYMYVCMYTYIHVCMYIICMCTTHVL